MYQIQIHISRKTLFWILFELISLTHYCIYHMFVSVSNQKYCLNQVPETKIAEFANSVELDEVAQHKPPHQIYTVCPLVFEFSIRYSLDLTFFENLQTKIFCRLLFGS